MKYATIIQQANSIDEIIEYINENPDEADEIAAQYAIQATDEAARSWDEVNSDLVNSNVISQLEFLSDEGAEFNSVDALIIAQVEVLGINFGDIE